MKILITGNKGFIGRNLQKKLEDLGHTVIGYDIGDQFPSERVDLVFHLASKVDAFGSTKRPTEGRDNINITYDVLEYMRQTFTRYIVFASSREVYGMNNPYAVSKKSCENIIENYCKLYSISAINARISNVFGAGNLGHRFISKTITQVANNEDIVIYGGDKKILNFVHVDDAVDKLISFGTLVSSNTAGCIKMDIASDRSWKLIDIAKTIIEEIGQSYTGEIKYRPNRWGETLQYIPKSGDLLIPDMTIQKVIELCRESQL